MQEYKGSPALDAGLLAAAQAVEHYEISRYGTLRTWAEELGHPDAASLLQETLDEEEATDQALTKIAKTAVNQEAEAYWVSAINNPALPAGERKDLIEDLNEDGFPDPHNVTLYDLPLILSRIRLIEEVAPDSLDDVNAEAFAEAYKDVVHEDAIKIGGATKAPDYCFRVGGTRKFFLEAKKPAVNLKQDPEPAYQLRRYAWSAGLPLSILTDFEEFAVYDCRVRPAHADKASAGRTQYLNYRDYSDRWDEIAGVFSRDAVYKGSFDKYAESMKGRKGTAGVDEAFLEEIERWRELRTLIHADVCRRGFDPARNAFVQAYGAPELDASLLMIPLVGFLPPDDPRVRGTVAAIERELMVDGLVMRYPTESGVDGLPAGEGVFLACSFWMVDNLVLQGRRDETRRLFDRLLGLRNDVGLLAEQYDPRARRQLGNFPQALSHIALINSASNLSGRLRPAEHRAGR